MTEEDFLDLENAEAVCRRFLSWNLHEECEGEADDVRAKLGEVLGRTISIA